MPRLFINIILVVLVLAGSARAGETVLADPPPSFDNPRLIMLSLTTDEAGKVNGILSNAINIQKFYGMDNVQVAIIAYGAGVRPLLRETSTVAERVGSLQMYGVEFVACGNTLTTLGKDADAVLDGVEVVTAGIPEIVERRLRGWQYIHP